LPASGLPATGGCVGAGGSVAGGTDVAVARGGAGFGAVGRGVGLVVGEAIFAAAFNETAGDAEELGSTTAVGLAELAGAAGAGELAGGAEVAELAGPAAEAAGPNEVTPTPRVPVLVHAAVDARAAAAVASTTRRT
jgi:hypothetical protein